MQVTLRTLFILLGLSALFCVAMLNAGPAWVMVWRTIAMISLLFSLLAIWYRNAETRAYWVGYLHGGGAYALLTLYALGGFMARPIWNDENIISGEVAAAVYRWLPDSKRVQKSNAKSSPNRVLYRLRSGSGQFAYAANLAPSMTGPPADFRYLFHAACIIVCGWIGAHVGVWLYRTRKPSRNDLK